MTAKIGGYTVTKGYFSGMFVLSVWDVHGETIHSSVHHFSEQAYVELERFRGALKEAYRAKR